MKAMILERCATIESRPLKLVDLDVPIPLAEEILIKISAVGICRTDLHVIEGDIPSKKLPIIPGHQIVGTVESCGVDSKRFHSGDRVGIAWLRYTCQQCSWCKDQKENLCDFSRYTGYHEHGGFAEYAVVDERFAYSIPDVFSDLQSAPLLCAGIIGFRALKRSAIKPGERLGLFGFGSSAHMTIQIAKSWGCKVFVASRAEEHRALARELGVDWVGNLDEQFPSLVDSAIVFAPVGEIVPKALASVRKAGTVSLAGIYMSNTPPLNYEKHLFHEKQLVSVESNTREDGEEFLQQAAAIPIVPRIQTFRLEAANEALIALKADRINGSGVLIT